MLLEITGGEGIYLFDSDGKKYIDMISGISVSNLGHGHPAIKEAIHQQTERYMHTMVLGEYVHTPQVKLAAKLAEVLPSSLESVYFTNSGSEAIEGALKLAKRVTGRSDIVAMNNSYHGSSSGALSLMSDPYFTDKFRPLLPGIRFMDQNDISQVEKKINSHTAAVVLEIVQAESGYNPIDIEFLKAIRSRCDETGTLMILDEIQTGMGRTGELFAFMHYDVIPDILCVAKAFGGGMPLGAFISSRSKMNQLSDEPVLGHITTFGGNPVCTAASLAALETLTDTKIYHEAAKKESLLRELLVHPEIKEITGKGLMLSVRLKSKPFLREVVRRCIEKGLIIDWFLFAEHYLRVAPPLIITEEEIIKACEIIVSSIEEASFSPEVNS